MAVKQTEVTFLIIQDRWHSYCIFAAYHSRQGFLIRSTCTPGARTEGKWVTKEGIMQQFIEIIVEN